VDRGRRFFNCMKMGRGRKRMPGDETPRLCRTEQRVRPGVQFMKVGTVADHRFVAAPRGGLHHHLRVRRGAMPEERGTVARGGQKSPTTTWPGNDFHTRFSSSFGEGSRASRRRENPRSRMGLAALRFASASGTPRNWWPLLPAIPEPRPTGVSEHAPPWIRWGDVEIGA